MVRIQNVITINDFNFIQGGASKVAIDSANMIAEKGLNSIFVSAVGKIEESDLKDNVIQYSLQNTEFLNYKNKIKGMYKGIRNKDFSSLVELILEQFSPLDTVVHVHGWTKACSSDFFKILKEKKFHVFLTLHDYFSICPNGALLNYKKNKSCNKKCMSFGCAISNCDSRNYIFKIYRFLREAEYKHDIDFQYIHPIFISEFQYKNMEKYLGNMKKYSILNNPVKFLDSLEVPIYDFVYIGRNSKEKGLDLFVEAAKKNKEYSFLIVGDYKKSERIDNLYITGWVKEDEVNDYLKKSKVFVLTSLLPEPFGLNLVKAVNAGIPCLAASNTSAIEFIENGKNGYIFQQGDFNSMNELISKVIKLPREKKNNKETSSYIENLIKIYTSS